jgi:hypothetical protein
MSSSLLRIVGRAIFFLGVILGYSLAIIMIWSRMEAIHYFFRGATHESFRGLHCPVMISPTEKGFVRAAFTNPTSEQVNFFYRVAVSGQEVVDQGLAQIAVSPRQTERVQFVVDANNVDLGFFIFVKIMISPNSLHQTQEAVCGIFVTNLLGLSGGQISTAALSLSFLGMGMGLGAGQWTGSSEDRNVARVMQALTLIVLMTLLVGVMGWWLPGMALSAITVLLIIISVRLAIA